MLPKRIRKNLRTAFVVVGLTWPSILCLMVFAAFASESPQFSEIVLGYAEHDGGWFRALRTLIAFELFVVLTLVGSAESISTFLTRNYSSFESVENNLNLRMLERAPRMLAAAAIILLIFSLVKTASFSRTASIELVKNNHMIVFWFCAACLVGIILIIIFFYTERRVAYLKALGLRSVSNRRTLVMNRALPILLACLYLALLVLLWASPDRLSDTFGVIAVFFLFLSLLMTFLYAFVRSNTAMGPALLLWVIGLTYFGYPHNNPAQVAELQPITRVGNGDEVAIRSEEKLPDIGTKFLDWLTPRIKDATKENPYPVFIVTAQGGGLYAAYHSALALARVQDRCPNFSKHVFAMSGVSGGGLGLAAFADAVHSLNGGNRHAGVNANFCTLVPGRTGNEKFISTFFKADFATPLATAGFLLDLPQQVIPFAVPYTDRSRYLSLAILGASRKARLASGSSLNSFFSESIIHQNDMEGRVPLLFTLATVIESGEAFVFGPTRLSSSDVGMTRTLDLWDVSPSADALVLEAVSISARFPFVMSTASVRNKKTMYNNLPSTINLVDGGYVDSSGARTASLIMSGIERDARVLNLRDKFKIVLLMFTHKNYDQERYSSVPTVFYPFRLLQRSSSHRSYEYVRALKTTIDESFQSSSDGIRYSAWMYYLDTTRDTTGSVYRPPLAWYLSNATKQNIGGRSGFTTRRGCSGPMPDNDLHACYVVDQVQRYYRNQK